MLCGACILPLLLTMLSLLLLWSLTLAVVSVSSWRKSRPSLSMHQLTRQVSHPQNTAPQATTLVLITLTPIGFLGLWLVFSSRPVQSKLMQPLLSAALRVTTLRRFLTVRAAPGW